jgi:hypothetical protein
MQDDSVDQTGVIGSEVLGGGPVGWRADNVNSSTRVVANRLGVIVRDVLH